MGENSIVLTQGWSSKCNNYSGFRRKDWV